MRIRMGYTLGVRLDENEDRLLGRISEILNEKDLKINGDDEISKSSILRHHLKIVAHSPSSIKVQEIANFLEMFPLKTRSGELVSKGDILKISGEIYGTNTQ